MSLDLSSLGGLVGSIGQGVYGGSLSALRTILDQQNLRRELDIKQNTILYPQIDRDSTIIMDPKAKRDIGLTSPETLRIFIQTANARRAQAGLPLWDVEAEVAKFVHQKAVDDAAEAQKNIAANPQLHPTTVPHAGIAGGYSASPGYPTLPAPAGPPTSYPQILDGVFKPAPMAPPVQPGPPQGFYPLTPEGTASPPHGPYAGPYAPGYVPPPLQLNAYPPPYQPPYTGPYAPGQGDPLPPGAAGANQAWAAGLASTPTAPASAPAAAPQTAAAPVPLASATVPPAAPPAQTPSDTGQIVPHTLSMPWGDKVIDIPMPPSVQRLFQFDPTQRATFWRQFAPPDQVTQLVGAEHDELAKAATSDLTIAQVPLAIQAQILTMAKTQAETGELGARAHLQQAQAGAIPTHTALESAQAGAVPHQSALEDAQANLARAQVGKIPSEIAQAKAEAAKAQADADKTDADRLQMPFDRFIKDRQTTLQEIQADADRLKARVDLGKETQDQVKLYNDAELGAFRARLAQGQASLKSHFDAFMARSTKYHLAPELGLRLRSAISAAGMAGGSLGGGFNFKFGSADWINDALSPEGKIQWGRLIFEQNKLDALGMTRPLTVGSQTELSAALAPIPLTVYNEAKKIHDGKVDGWDDALALEKLYNSNRAEYILYRRVFDKLKAIDQADLVKAQAAHQSLLVPAPPPTTGREGAAYRQAHPGPSQPAAGGYSLGPNFGNSGPGQVGP